MTEEIIKKIIIKKEISGNIKERGKPLACRNAHVSFYELTLVLWISNIAKD